jgi:hypothetical protein
VYVYCKTRRPTTLLHVFFFFEKKTLCLVTPYVYASYSPSQEKESTHVPAPLVHANVPGVVVGRLRTGGRPCPRGRWEKEEEEEQQQREQEGGGGGHVLLLTHLTAEDNIPDWAEARRRQWAAKESERAGRGDLGLGLPVGVRGVCFRASCYCVVGLRHAS